MPRKDKDRLLTPEEQTLWQELSASTSPLTKRERNPEAKKPGRLQVKQESTLPAPPALGSRLDELKQGEYKDIDGRLKERFRKGELPVDGRLDLHGKTREEARYLVHDFIIRHYQKESRFLLIITGKGRPDPEESGPGQGHGILRKMCVYWLNEPDIRPFILAFDTARAGHGGAGAFYILLRRHR